MTCIRELEPGRPDSVVHERLLAAFLVRLCQIAYQHVGQHDQEGDDRRMAPVELLASGIRTRTVAGRATAHKAPGDQE